MINQFSMRIRNAIRSILSVKLMAVAGIILWMVVLTAVNVYAYEQIIPLEARGSSEEITELESEIESEGLSGIDTRQKKKIYNNGYGVYLGVDDYSRLKKLISDNDIIVIDGQLFSKKQIRKLKEGGRKVYSYLDIGSLETYRPYYKKFKHLAMDPYENWPDEYWIDVSDKSWQDFIGRKIAGELYKKGVDGFFIDNCDVYSVYDETNRMYKGLVSILKKLHKYDADTIINGGDIFVKRLIKENKTYLIEGINQETVFSRIVDYDDDVFAAQKAKETKYYKSYITKAKKSGLKVFLLEYTTDKAVKKKINSYCRKNGFRYFISGRVNLDGKVRY